MSATTGPTAGELQARRDEVVAAACSWSGAAQYRRRRPSEASDRVLAKQEQRLFDAVDAFLVTRLLDAVAARERQRART